MHAPQWHWVNHGHDAFVGWTLTLPVKDGAVLSSSLTTLLNLAAGACWGMTAYTMHQIRASARPITADEALLQFSFINSTSPGGDAWKLFCLARAWRHIKMSISLKFLLYLLVPLTQQVVFIVLGVFISRILAPPGYDASPILLKPGLCGEPLFNVSNPRASFAWAYKVSNETQAARTYVQQCYQGPTTSGLCDTLPVAALSQYSTTFVDCPWSSGRCVLPTGAYQLESQWIDSHLDLGINARLEDRVAIKYRNTCSVITWEDLLHIVPDNTTGGLFDLLQFNLGTVPGSLDNITYEISTHSQDSDLPYSVTAVYANAGNVGGIDAVLALSQSNADQMFAFVGMQSVTFDGPSKDPLFLASGNYTLGDRTAPDSYVQIMACMDQRMIRNPVNGYQTTPLGLSQLEGGMAWTELGFNDAQFATAMRLISNMATTDTYNTVNGQNSAALQATSLASQLFSPRLPDDQWMIELRGWFEIGLAKLQHAVVQHVDNTWVADSGYPLNVVYLQTVGDEPNATIRAANEYQCRNQLSRSLAGYQSFCLLGVIIVIIYSCTMVILNWCLSSIVRRFHRKNPSKQHKYYADVKHGKYALAVDALRAAGYDGWLTVVGDHPENTHTDYPVRKPNHRDIRAPTAANGHVYFPVRAEPPVEILLEGVRDDADEAAVALDRDHHEVPHRVRDSILSGPQRNIVKPDETVNIEMHYYSDGASGSSRGQEYRRLSNASDSPSPSR